MGQKMAIGEVMFLAAIAWVKRGDGGGELFNKNTEIHKNNCLLIYINGIFSHLLTVICNYSV